MKMMGLFLAFAFCTSAETAKASQQDFYRAYHSAQRCYVANGYLYDTFKDAGDSANARLFNAKAKRAFDAANGYAVFLNLSREQIEADYNEVTNTELRKLMTDKAYLTKVAKDCKLQGLM